MKQLQTFALITGIILLACLAYKLKSQHKTKQTKTNCIFCNNETK